MEEYFREEHADTVKKQTFARPIRANMAPCSMLPPCCPRASRGVLLLLLSWRASSLHEGLVTCCNLAYFESSSCALLQRHQQSQTERDVGPAESRQAAEVFYSLSSEVEPLNASLTIIMSVFVVGFCKIKVLLEGPQAQLPAQMLPNLRSRSGFSSRSSAEQLQLCKYVKQKCLNTWSPNSFSGSHFIISNTFEQRRQAANTHPELGLLCIYYGLAYSGLVFVVFFITMVFHNHKSCCWKGRQVQTQCECDPDHLYLSWCSSSFVHRVSSFKARTTASCVSPFLPSKMVMTWPPFRINLHEINNISTLWVFVEGSESSKAKRGNENCPLSYSGQIHQLIICIVQFASAWNYSTWHLCSAPGNWLCSPCFCSMSGC